MKRTLISLFTLFALFEGIYALAATYQPLNLGYVLFAISSGTVTDIQNSTQPVGTSRFCANCAAAGNAGTVCFSTGAVNWGSFVLSTGTRCQ